MGNLLRGRGPRAVGSRRGLTVPERNESCDGDLLTAYTAGDPRAIGALFDRHAATVHRFLSRLAGIDAPQLDDLVQATFLEVCRSAGRFRGASSLRTWILRIAANVARHHVRGDARRRALLRAYGPPPRLPDSRGPDALAENRELLARLRSAVASLPADLRICYVMCDLEEMPGVEAAHALGLPEGTVWRRLCEARKFLRAALEGRRSSAARSRMELARTAGQVRDAAVTPEPPVRPRQS